MGLFNNNKTQEQITLQKVVDSYKTIPLYISEVYYPNVGWLKTDMKASTEKIWILAMCDATYFNFKIINEYGELKYSDFSLNELVKN
jgi:hypothetical protein